ncbi:MAG: carboxypeptidase-like regulatory domain-containing protein, partial [Acidobacteriota bacterium]
GGAAPVARALEASLAPSKLSGHPSTVILVAGGADGCGGDPCSALGPALNAGVIFRLHVIAFGADVDGARALECAADAGGGRFYSVDEAYGLAAALQAAADAPPDVPTGGLRLGASADGRPADVTVHVTDTAGGRRGFARTQTDPSTNPSFIPLPPGRYRATVSALAIKGARREQFDFVVEAEEILERHFDFSAALLRVGATHNGERGDAVVRVKNAAGKQVAAGRLRAGAPGSAKSFRLHPGEYTVSIASAAIAGEPERRHRVELAVGEPVEILDDFESGGLTVTVTDAGELAEGLVTVRPAGERRELAKKRARAHDRGNPVRFTLEPGRYAVEVRDVGGGRRASRSTAEITAGEDTAISATFDAGGGADEEKAGGDGEGAEKQSGAPGRPPS